jgi:hypothetical protein
MSNYLNEILNADKFRYFKYVPEDAGKSHFVVVDRNEIYAMFKDYWEKMIRAVGRGPILDALTEKQKRTKCVEDWVLLNYAVPYNDD